MTSNWYLVHKGMGITLSLDDAFLVNVQGLAPDELEALEYLDVPEDTPVIKTSSELVDTWITNNPPSYYPPIPNGFHLVFWANGSRWLECSTCGKHYNWQGYQTKQPASLEHDCQKKERA